MEVDMGGELLLQLPVELVADRSGRDALEVLRLDRNRLSAIPEFFAQFSALQELHLANNLIEKPLSRHICSNLLSLRLLDLERNNLAQMGPLGLLSSLEHLHLGHNRIHRWDPSLFSLSLLRTLRLEHNMLTGELPPSIASLCSLEVLVLASNDFSHLSNSLLDLTALRELHIDDNPSLALDTSTREVLMVCLDGLPELLIKHDDSIESPYADTRTEAAVTRFFAAEEEGRLAKKELDILQRAQLKQPVAKRKSRIRSRMRATGPVNVQRSPSSLSSNLEKPIAIWAKGSTSYDVLLNAMRSTEGSMTASDELSVDLGGVVRKPAHPVNLRKGSLGLPKPFDEVTNPALRSTPDLRNFVFRPTKEGFVPTSSGMTSLRDKSPTREKGNDRTTSKSPTRRKSPLVSRKDRRGQLGEEALETTTGVPHIEEEQKGESHTEEQHMITRKEKEEKECDSNGGGLEVLEKEGILEDTERESREQVKREAEKAEEKRDEMENRSVERKELEKQKAPVNSDQQEAEKILQEMAVKLDQATEEKQEEPEGSSISSPPTGKKLNTSLFGAKSQRKKSACKSEPAICSAEESVNRDTTPNRGRGRERRLSSSPAPPRELTGADKDAVSLEEQLELEHMLRNTLMSSLFDALSILTPREGDRMTETKGRTEEAVALITSVVNHLSTCTSPQVDGLSVMRTIRSLENIREDSIEVGLLKRSESVDESLLPRRKGSKKRSRRSSSGKKRSRTGSSLKKLAKSAVTEKNNSEASLIGSHSEALVSPREETSQAPMDKKSDTKKERSGSAGDRRSRQERSFSVESLTWEETETIVDSAVELRKTCESPRGGERPLNRSGGGKRTTMELESSVQFGRAPCTQFVEFTLEISPSGPLLFAEEEDGTRLLCAGQPASILEYLLLCPGTGDELDLFTFFLAFRQWMSSEHVLNTLFSFVASGATKSDALRTRELERVKFFLTSWVQWHFTRDFWPTPKLIESMLQMISGLPAPASEPLTRTVEQHLEECAHNTSTVGTVNPRRQSVAATMKSSHLEPLLRAASPTPRVALLSFQPEALAEHLATFEFNIFRSIASVDCLTSASRRNCKEIQQLIQRFNCVSLWVATEIVKETVAKRRVAVIKTMVAVAEHSLRINSFNTLLEIVAGLSLGPVERLRKTWKAVPKRCLESLSHMETLLDGSGNFAAYRHQLRGCSLPCLPYFGIFLRDLTYVNEVNYDTVEVQGSKLVNFLKLRQIAELTRTIAHWQSTPYAFELSPSLQNYVANLVPFTDRKSVV